METANEEVEEVKNEEGAEEYSNEVIEEGTKNEDKRKVEALKNEEAEHKPKPKANRRNKQEALKLLN